MKSIVCTAAVLEGKTASRTGIDTWKSGEQIQ